MSQDISGVVPAGTAIPSTAQGDPILMGAADGSGNLQRLTVDGSGNLNTTATISGSVTVSSGVAQGSTTASQIGPLVQGAVTTASPSYTNGQTDPLSLTPSGELRTAIIRLNGAVVNLGNGVTDTGTQRVTIASDSTGTVAVTQATASSLNAQVVGAVASAGSNAGNPVKAGGAFNTTQPTVTTGQIVDAQMTARGAQIVATGVDAFAVSGTAAAGAAASGNPVQTGGVYNSTPPTPSTGQIEPLQMGEGGQVINLPYAPLAKNTSGTNSTASAATISAVIADPGAGLSFYMTGCYTANTGSTASLISVLATGGTTFYTTINPAGGGSNAPFNTPIKFTAHKAIDVTMASASTTQYVTLTGFIAP